LIQGVNFGMFIEQSSGYCSPDLASVINPGFLFARIPEVRERVLSLA
jgi:hypothetical protein